MSDYPNTPSTPPGGAAEPAASPAAAPGAGAQPAPGPGQPTYASAPQPGAGPGQPYRQPFNPFDPRRKSPALASFLSLVPGLGQVYVGYYQRGFFNIITVAGTIAALAGFDLPDFMYPLLGIFLAFFVLYNIIDAGRRASLVNQALDGQAAGTLPEDISLPQNGSVAGGVTLMVAGFVLLMNTAFDWDFRWLESWWPLAPIGFGVWLFLQGIKDRVQAD